MLENLTVPEFTARSTGPADFVLSQHRGQILVLYFYPKDNTPGCTDEGIAFRDLHEAFVALGAVILGVSRDSLRSHGSFRAKMNFPFDLLSDEDEALCTQFGVMKMKNLYGKPVRGIERSTFVIDDQGVMRKEWRGVKVPGHAQAVLDFLRTLKTP